MKVGDLIKLQSGTCAHWGLPTGIALLVEKLPLDSINEYDWRVLVDGRCIELGRQIEQSSEMVHESR
jgi:hypothetical protein